MLWLIIICTIIGPQDQRNNEQVFDSRWNIDAVIQTMDYMVEMEPKIKPNVDKYIQQFRHAKSNGASAIEPRQLTEFFTDFIKEKKPSIYRVQNLYISISMSLQEHTDLTENYVCISNLINNLPTFVQDSTERAYLELIRRDLEKIIYLGGKENFSVKWDTMVDDKDYSHFGCFVSRGQFYLLINDWANVLRIPWETFETAWRQMELSAQSLPSELSKNDSHKATLLTSDSETKEDSIECSSSRSQTRSEHGFVPNEIRRIDRKDQVECLSSRSEIKSARSEHGLVWSEIRKINRKDLGFINGEDLPFSRTVSDPF